MADKDTDKHQSEFLTPTSALTPTAVGGRIVIVGLPLADGFDMSFKWVALILSLLLGTLVVYATAKEAMNLAMRALLVILNSLMIFFRLSRSGNQC